MNVNLAKYLLSAYLVGLFGASDVAAREDYEFIRANPDGYQVVPSQNSPGTARFRAKVDRKTQAIEYELAWSKLKGDILQSHIHFGRPNTNGDIVLFLCTDLDNTPDTAAPAPRCSNSEEDKRSGMATGILHATDIVALGFGSILPDQQLLPFADFEELAKAIEVGATYVVVHTEAQRPGELRGNITGRRHRKH